MKVLPNTKYIEQLADGDVQFMQSCITVLKTEFVIDTDAYFEQFKQQEFYLCAKLVHKLKHKLLMLGLEGLCERIAVYEEELKQANTDFHLEFEKQIKEIKIYLNTLG